jgi:hypothetical protein
MFPHGSEGGNDLTGPGENYLWAGDSKEVFRRFLRDFPVLPIPPTPPAIAAAPDCFDIPKTGHVLAAEEREREEAAERESARLAAEAAEERLRRQRDQGKKVLRAEEEDGEDDDSSSRKGSVFAEQLEDTRAHVLVAHAVCGVPPRRSARALPPAPSRALGRLVLASRVANSSGLAPELPGMSVVHASTLPPVGLSWSGPVDQLTPATPSVLARRTGSPSAAAITTPGPSSPLNLNKLKAVSAAKIAPPDWSDYVSGYIERSNLALEEIVESEQLIQESHTEERQYFYVGRESKRKRKKESKKAFY